MDNTIVLPEQILSGFFLDPDLGYVFHTNPTTFQLTLGETYVVVWDEEPYLVTAEDASDFQTGYILLGNGNYVGLSGNGEPFAIGWSPYGVSYFALLDPSESHQIGIYTEGIYLKDHSGRRKIHYGIDELTVDTTKENQQAFTKGELLEDVSTEVDFKDGDMLLQLPDGYLARECTIKKPLGLVPENIKRGTTIAGIKGILTGDSEEIEVVLDFSEGDQVVTPTTTEVLISKATIKKPSTLTPEVIADGVNVAGIVGSLKVTTATKLPAAIMDATLSFPFSELTEDTVFPSPVQIKSSAFTGTVGLQKVDLLNVLRIENSAFARCPDLQEIRFDKCSYVGLWAFASCSNLRTAYMPELTGVATEGFSYCSKLSSVHMPKVTKLDDRAFYGCSSLAQVSFPVCSELGSYALAGTKGPYYLPALKWFGERAIYGTSSYCSAYYYSDILTSTAYASTYYQSSYWPLQSNTRIIGGLAFSSKRIYGVTNSANVQYIGPRAFESCSYLKSASFPACKGISSGAFNYCKSLSSVYFPEVEEVGAAMFVSCTSLTTVEFPKVRSLYSSTFGSCSVRTVSLPVCSLISGGAFSMCYYLSSLYAPECKIVGGWAFYRCSALSTIPLPLCEYIDYAAFSNCNKLTTASLSKCSLVSDYAFYGCSSLATVSFPECTLIGSNAFYACSKLASASFPECSKVSSYAFIRCSLLSTLSLPKCTVIGNGAFSSCTALKTLYLMGSEYVTLEGSSVFYGAGTTSIYVPSSMLTNYKTKSYWSSMATKFVGV